MPAGGLTTPHARTSISSYRPSRPPRNLRSAGRRCTDSSQNDPAMAISPTTTDASITRTPAAPADAEPSDSPATSSPAHAHSGRYPASTPSQARRPVHYLATKATANSSPSSKKLAPIATTVMKAIQQLQSARPTGDSQVTSPRGSED